MVHQLRHSGPEKSGLKYACFSLRARTRSCLIINQILWMCMLISSLRSLLQQMKNILIFQMLYESHPLNAQTHISLQLQPFAAMEESRLNLWKIFSSLIEIPVIEIFWVQNLLQLWNSTAAAEALLGVHFMKHMEFDECAYCDQAEEAQSHGSERDSKAWSAGSLSATKEGETRISTILQCCRTVPSRNVLSPEAWQAGN